MFSVKAQQSLSLKYKFLCDENHATMNFVKQHATHYLEVPSDCILGRRKGDLYY